MLSRTNSSRGMSRWLWLAVFLPAVLSLVTLLFAQGIDSWAWLSGSAHAVVFSDLQQITATATCVAEDSRWSIESETCDPNGRAYNYPEAWARGFAFVGFGYEDTNLLGWALVTLALLAITLLGWRLWSSFDGTVTRHQLILRVALWVAAAISPPVWLAMDRGNSDIVIFLLVVISLLVTVRSIPVIPGLVLALGAFLKIFAFGAGLMLVTMTRFRLLTTLTWLAGVIGALVIIYPSLGLISLRTPRSHWMSFGVSVLPIRYQSLLGEYATNGRVIGLIAAGLFAVSLASIVALLQLKNFRSYFRNTAQSLAGNRVSAAAFLGGAGVFLVSYLVGTSYDYRLIFLSLVVGSLVINVGRNDVSQLLTAGVLVGLMWCSGPWQILGDSADWLWLIVSPALLVLLVFLLREFPLRQSTRVPDDSYKHRDSPG